jgi:hypothetical protein
MKAFIVCIDGDLKLSFMLELRQVFPEHIHREFPWMSFVKTLKMFWSYALKKRRKLISDLYFIKQNML